MQEEDLKNFFDDMKNIYFVFGGLIIVGIASVVGIVICRVAEKKKRNGLLDDVDEED